MSAVAEAPTYVKVAPRIRYVCRVLPNPAKVEAFSIAGVSFALRRLQTFSKKEGRAPIEVLPTQDITAEQADAVRALLPKCALRPRHGLIKPVRMKDGSYAEPMFVEGDLPVADFVEFREIRDEVNLVAENEALRAQVAELQRKLRADGKDEESLAAQAEAEEQTKADRAVGPRNKQRAS